MTGAHIIWGVEIYIKKLWWESQMGRVVVGRIILKSILKN
jgi:hypothetical protein